MEFLIFFVWCLRCCLAVELSYSQKKINVLSFTNEYDQSLFPVLQWCALVKIYTFYPSLLVKKNFKDKAKLTKNMKRIENTKDFAFAFDHENTEAISRYILNIVMKKKRNWKTFNKEIDNIDNGYFVMNRIDAVLQNKEYNDKEKELLDEVNDALTVTSMNIKKEQQSNKEEQLLKYKDVHEITAEEIFKIKANMLLPEIDIKRDSAIGILNGGKQNKTHNNKQFECLYKILLEYANLEKTNNVLYVLVKRICKALVDMKTLEIDRIAGTIIKFFDFIVNTDIKKQFDMQVVLDAYYSNDREQLTEVPGCEFSQILFNFLDAIVYLHEQLLNCAFNENINESTEQSFQCLRFWSDMNMLLHLAIFLINEKTESNIYFLFTMDEVVNEFLGNFYQTEQENESTDRKKVNMFVVMHNEITQQSKDVYVLNNIALSVKEKLEILLDGSKTFKNMKTRGIISSKCNAATLEFWADFPAVHFIDNFINSIVLAATDPILWGLPDLSSEINTEEQKNI